LTGGLIHRCHQRQLHAGAEQTLAFLRQRYWVPKGRHQVKRMARECMVCRRAIACPAQPRMAALPRDRAVQALTMSQVGINIARSLFVRVGRGATSPRSKTIQFNNFPSFQEAASELRQLWQTVNMGRYWERLVRSVKESLRKVLGKALLDDGELQTILCEVEACLNARPLTFINDGPGDPQPL
ncbi:hypothetical protein T08_6084, partial [Trichinella sp. T8]